MPVRVATLTRRSLDQAHQPFSIEAQDTKLKAYIQSQDDWQLVRTYSDDMSGATLDRPGLQASLRDARVGRFDVLLVYRVDRIARSLRGLLEILDELDRAGVAFRSVSEHFDTATPVGRMLIQILGAFAEFERATIIDRIVAGMERKAARGAWCGGYRPFGYQVDPITHYLVPHPEEAPLVPVIFDLYANQRLGAKAIAGRLNDGGHRTRTGRPWNHLAILTVLRNRVYLGEIYFRGSYHPAPHPPLVDQPLFDAAQALLAERGDTPAQRAASATAYLLTGRVVCDRCGKRYLGVVAHGRSQPYRYYTCYTRHRYGTPACAADRLAADQLDQAVLQALLATYQETDLFERAISTARSQTATLREQYQGELRAVGGEIGKAEAAIDRYLDAFEAGTLREQQCGRRIETLTAKLVELKTRQDELRDLLDTAHDPTPDPQELAELLERVRAAVQHGPLPVRKTLVDALVEEIRVHSRDHIVPVFRLSNGHHQPDGAVRPGVSWVAPTGFEPALPP
jgi:site-specific DNA recombinase